ncbi:MAG: hypothetical protein NE330_12935 [Lentisphaeraceae bacterium]|nr:hypothetical protein [Lentisphaeraceae bacterium]
MSLQNEEQDELVELVEEQADVIQEMAITQNALVALLMNKGLLGSEELEDAREQIKVALAES